MGHLYCLPCCWPSLLAVHPPSLSSLLSPLTAWPPIPPDTACRVMDRFPANGKLLKIYGRFLEYVRNDPWNASRYGGGVGGGKRVTRGVQEIPRDSVARTSSGSFQGGDLRWSCVAVPLQAESLLMHESPGTSGRTGSHRLACSACFSQPLGSFSNCVEDMATCEPLCQATLPP